MVSYDQATCGQLHPCHLLTLSSQQPWATSFPAQPGQRTCALWAELPGPGTCSVLGLKPLWSPLCLLQGWTALGTFQALNGSLLNE